MLKQTKYTELELVTMFQQLFSGKAGEAVKDWLDHAYGKLSYVPSDPHGTSFNEGQRSVLLQIDQFLKVDIKELEDIQKETEDV
jgi:hypothetical protein